MKKSLLFFTLLLVSAVSQAQWRVPCAKGIYFNKEHRHTTRTQHGVPNVFQGEKRGLIILMNFQDVKFTDKNKNGKTFDVHDFWNDIANKEGLKNVNGVLVNGSIRDYFLAQSYGNFTIDFDVRGPYTAKNKYAYYGRNTVYGNGHEFDQNPVELIVEAVNAANSEVNYKDYDWDGDGVVDQVYVIYAGYGEASYEDDPDLIWPHESEIDIWDIGEVILQGVKINTYACGNELGPSGRTMGIGTICHEFSHCLGLLDVYNTESGEGVVYYYDLMDAGNYNGDSWYPAGYSSFERYFCGWLEPTRVSSVDEVPGLELRPLTQYPDAAIITREMGSTEFYLVEKRVKESWDKFLPCFTQTETEATLGWHIVYDLPRWQNNLVNTDPEHMGITLIPLDEIPSYPGSTAIVAPESTAEGPDAWYDLQGRRLSVPPTQKGIYIHNNKKVAK